MPRAKRKVEENIVEDKFNEKKKLLQALEDHGPSVIYDWDLLKSYFPLKSPAEIKFLIKSYERKGKELSQKQNHIDKIPGMKNISQWSSIIYKCVSSQCKKDDLSTILKDVFGKMGELFPSSSTSMVNDDDGGGIVVDDEDNVDYQAIHSYFNSILDNRFPAQLEDREAAVVLLIMDSLTKMVEQLDISNEEKFLASETWWKPTPATTNGVQDEAQNEQNANNGSDNPNDPEYYFNLPRILNIRKCLNPLMIPSEILSENHELTASYLI